MQPLLIAHTPTNTLRQSADQQVVVEEAAETPAPRFRMLPPQHYMRYDGHPHTTTATRCCLADIYDLLLLECAASWWKRG